MNLATLMDEVAAVLEQISDIGTAYGWPPGTLTPPAAYVTYPESVDFDQAYGRGVDKITGLKFGLVSGRVTDRTSRDRVGSWAAGAGPTSVKQIMESHRWVSCDDLTVTGCTFDVESIGDIDYLVAVFAADVFGKGT